ncbi:hypothetical protein KCU77_g3888, partial [Aureobasidium melanogenum]
MTASSNSATVVATSAPTSSSPSEPTSDKVRSHNQGDNESAAAKPLRHDHKSVQLQDIANTVYTSTATTSHLARNTSESIDVKTDAAILQTSTSRAKGM